MAKKNTKVQSRRSSAAQKTAKIAKTTAKPKKAPARSAKKPKANPKKAKQSTQQKVRQQAKTTARQALVRKAGSAKPSARISAVAPTPAPVPVPARVPKVKAAKKDPEEPKTPYCPKGYTPDQYAKYKDEKARLSDMGNKQLKQMLKKNLQSMSGNKDELIQKIADGIVLGRIPRCPSCSGGRPRYDNKKGTYSCPGYRDDEDYINCHKQFTKQELKRDPWEA